MRIGELAGLAGVSTRTVRHYHRIGLLPEPRRRENGYRSYELRDLVLLLRARRLVELGLSLEEVADALSDDRGRDLVEIIREIDADLAAQQQRIAEQRSAIATLLAADGDLRSPDLVAVLDTLADHPAADREGMAAELLESLIGNLDLYRSVLADPVLTQRMLAVYAEFEALVDISPNDPAVDELAARVRDFGPAVLAMMPPDVPSIDTDPETLLSAVSAGMSAAQTRCLRLMLSHWQQ
ncbi:MerR family transcriptional regulator [Kutzneria buriramensis]|uniref:DNA-binding transcriptional MerR regulator n=1 Tax=Kutzneria buriramensis TaxID=1045776 RepID=A0A3E0I577_9PSEU|nr:MerR family transcriptional regulator [Kutzneria buriramensis]REH53908.1 DNA-binding transcriptional MerR regulator [Kutzneria buriramensis]